MTLRIAINGFGRIGRMVLRAGINNPDLEFVACNDLTDKETLAYLFKYDSVHKEFSGTVSTTENGLLINGKELLVFAERNPEQLPWNSLNIDVVVESTGLFRTREQLNKHLSAGAKKVILSAPAKDKDIPTVVLGVNEHTINFSKETILSNASCTTNCLAPLVKVLDDNFGVEKGFMTTIHSFTGDQNLVDGPHSDKRRGRCASVNMVPTTTGAAKAVGLVLPHLQGKLDGFAMRVPTPNGSFTDLVCELKRPTSVDEINTLFSQVAKHHLFGILQYQDEPIVSSDIITNPHSSIFDPSVTFVLGNLIKIGAWYDNEWGYSNRVIDILNKIYKGGLNNE
jgi:glyceraldehyde 3-phosphate dehydrogenase